MKKVITILAILVVLTSAVFAETHKLTIQATSTKVDPVFQMTIGSITTNTDNSKFDTANNDSLVKTDIADTFTFELGGEVGIIVTIQNPAKTKQNYLLTFGDGIFRTIKKNGESAANIGPKSIVTTEVTDTGFSSTGTNGTVKVDFNGTKCTAGATLCTATYKYDADQTVDPGEYTADIELVITTTT